MTAEKELLACNFSHLFSDETRRRKSSPIKTTMAYFQDPNIVFLGAGMPPSELFPLESITIEMPKPPFTSAAGKRADCLKGTIMKEHEDLVFENDVPLARALQYGNSRGQKELLAFLKEHVSLFHRILYKDWDIITTTGSTQGWDASLRIFCNKGDTVLLEDYTYSSSVEAADAQGLNCVPMPLDGEGIVPSKLEEMLANWSSLYGEMPMPKLLYTIPTGQNPTGCTLSDNRKPHIYRLAQQYDIIIIEDDPYYFLQMDPYVSEDARLETAEASTMSQATFMNSLNRSFLELDTDGRVVRLESVSKTFAPGCRMGWLVGSKHLLDNYWNLHEVSIQSTCGFAQTILSGILNRWGQDGYIDWLMRIRRQYTGKRNTCLDNCYKYLPAEIVSVPPVTAGMFFMVFIDAEKHPEFHNTFKGDVLLLENHIYQKCVSAGVLITCSSWFKVNDPKPSCGKSADNTLAFRGTFASVEPEAMARGLQIFGETLKQEFKLV
ncbi:PLP-dependent aminotransferase family protein [Lachancea thermotolerans CBS 6340]|uniref:aromatic-amino-acid transaminase n=1 Tax=Lachancea thermotolerans (strain ATCC 56472 / CBS 6340 / NRRL Y-8284) TaxID=559295 RepID=C5DHW5_LACTC|nr:KLTH0E07678p [Lachancea thermotolerans CBS 6340]CAR23376.1 KLTH0E07678p [Lachancea thermotolerans CBS 6340]